jgi:hypothetical protein
MGNLSILKMKSLQKTDLAKVNPKDLADDIENVEGDEVKPEDLPLKKRIFYATMVKTFGNVSQACMLANIKRATYRKWLKEDPKFAELINGGDFEDRLLDFAESKLAQKIQDGDIIAILFTLKTRGKKRGYIEGNSSAPPQDPNKIPTWFDEPKKELPAGNPNQKYEEAEIVNENNPTSLDEKAA